jgi:predicted DNA-binding protein with PD1-like motif
MRALERPEDFLHRFPGSDGCAADGPGAIMISRRSAMKTALLHDHDGLRVFAVILSAGEEAVRAVTTVAREQRLKASQFTAIGAFERAVVAWFDWSAKEYRHIPIDEQVEVLSLVGDITVEHETTRVHGHVVLGKQDGTAHGGHLIEAYVRPTLELVITEMPRHLYRRYDAESGLALIDPVAKR